MRRVLHRHWKVVLLSLSLLVTVYFLAMGLFWPPHASLFVAWDERRRAVVEEAATGAAVDGAGVASEVLPGDVLLAIDGRPMRYSDLYLRFGPPAPLHTYLLEREGVRFTVALDSGQPSPRDWALPLLAALTALLAWAVGAVTLYFASARREDEDARAVGGTSLTAAVVLAATAATGMGIPGSRTAYEALLPLLSLGLVRVGFAPGLSHASSGRARLFRWLHAFIGVAWAFTLAEIFVVNPHRSLADLPVLSPNAVRLAVLALSALAMPAITFRRLLGAPRPHRQALGILLAGMAVALLPLVLLSILPDLAGDPLLPYDLTTAGLLALPMAYAVVIYRHRYLGLDIFLTRALTVLVIAVLASALYGLGAWVSRRVFAAGVEPLLGGSFMLTGLVALGAGRGRLQAGVDHLLFGPQRQYQALLADVSRRLAADPRPDTLTGVLLGSVPALLEVRQAGLWLVDGEDELTSIGALRVGALPVLPRGLLPEGLVLRVRHPEAELFDHVPWATAAFPLVVHGDAIGVWALGPKHPAQPFDAREVEFLAAVANAGAVAADNMRLFEALREMSQNLMQTAASERRALSSRIHDDPLQLVARMVDALGVAMRDLPPGSALSVTLSGLLRDLKALARELRDICAGIRPPILGQGLQFTLRGLVRTFQRDHSVPASLEFRCDPELDLPDRALDAVYHVVTEALNNVAKHANARRVTLTVEQIGDGLRISVADDGRTNGPPSASLGELVRKHHFGLAGMFNQAEGAGGRLEIENGGAGTRVRLTLPLSESKRE